MAALRGGTILSGSVLEGRSGAKVTYNSGLMLPVAVFTSNDFKRQEPGMTMILRDACSHGWQAVAVEGLRGRGRRPSLHLKASSERVQGVRGVLLLTGNEFVTWLTGKCVNKTLTARVQAKP